MTRAESLKRVAQSTMGQDEHTMNDQWPGMTEEPIFQCPCRAGTIDATRSSEFSPSRTGCLARDRCGGSFVAPAARAKEDRSRPGLPLSRVRAHRRIRCRPALQD